MGRTLKAQAKNQHGDELTVHSQDSDALVLPVAQLQALHQFRPDLVDFVVNETKLEASHRREQESRINLFIFIERLVGQVAALLIAGAGIGGGIYAGLNGQPWLGGAIVTATIGTLAVAFIRRNPPQ
jgi:hypothetical protein